MPAWCYLLYTTGGRCCAADVDVISGDDVVDLTSLFADTTLSTSFHFYRAIFMRPRLTDDQHTAAVTMLRNQRLRGGALH